MRGELMKAYQHISEEMIVDYILGNLSRDDHFKVRSHIKRCKRCELEIKSWEHLLQGEISKQPSSNFKQHLLATINHWQVRTKQRFTFVTISLCMVLVIGLVYFQLAKQKQFPHDVEHLQLAEQHMQDIDELIQTDHYMRYLQQMPTFTPTSNGYHELLNDHIHVNALSNLISPNQRLNSHKNVSQTFFMLHDGSICTIDPKQMHMQCVVYTIDDNNKIVPVRSKTYELIVDK